MKHRRFAFLGVALAVALLGAGCVGIQEPDGWAAPVEVNGGLLVQSDRGQLSFVDRDTGSVAWRYPEDADGAAPYYATPIVSGDQVYLAAYDGRIARIQSGGVSPTEDWSIHLESNVVATPLLNGDALFIPTEDGAIHVLNTDTGRIQRTIQTSERRIWGSPVATSSTVFIGDLDNRATAAFNTATGDLLWEQGISGATAADLALDGDLLFVGSFDEHLHALDVTNGGEERWAFEGDGWFMARPLVSGDTLYAVTMGGGVYAIDRDTGDPRWSQVIDDAEFRAAPVVAGDSLVAVTRDGGVYALALASGNIQWSQRVVEDGRVDADVYVDDSDLYLVTSTHRLVRVDLSTNGAFQTVPLVADR